MRARVLAACWALGVVLGFAGCHSGAPQTATPSPAAKRQAPGGTVVATDGTRFDLADAYADSRALIVFYRGHW